MARTRLPDTARVSIGLRVSEADAARIDQVLARPEFEGWSRSEWCVEIIRSALRYYAGDPPTPKADRAPSPARQPDPGPTADNEPAPSPARDGSRPGASEAAAEPVTAATEPMTEPSAQPDCPHPPDARDYQTGTCAACGAILWD